jgi:hypothetical protein
MKSSSLESLYDKTCQNKVRTVVSAAPESMKFQRHSISISIMVDGDRN